jgi:hypothetical protein
VQVEVDSKHHDTQPVGAENAMIQLYDAEEESLLGTISEEQLQSLIDSLEEESPTDQDYYLTSATIDMLEDDGADAELLRLLREALGDREGMDVRWVRE